MSRDAFSFYYRCLDNYHFFSHNVALCLFFYMDSTFGAVLRNLCPQSENKYFLLFLFKWFIVLHVTFNI